MSGASVVIIIGNGGTQQNRMADYADAESESIKVRVTRLDGESMGDVLRRAAAALDGAS